VTARRYAWHEGGSEHELVVVRVPGTRGAPFSFGSSSQNKPVEVPDFFIGATQVTQALWQHVMGVNPSVRIDPRCPVDNVSWNHIVEPGGFLERLNSSPVLAAVAQGEALRFRLPSETEWEYAARGGPHWRDGYRFSGSDDPDAVAWHGPNWSGGLGVRPLAVRLFGWRVAWRLFKRRRRLRPPRTHEVATKAPNQLGLYDMSGQRVGVVPGRPRGRSRRRAGRRLAVRGRGRRAPVARRMPRQLGSALHRVVALWHRAGRARRVHRLQAGALVKRRMLRSDVRSV
jgi:hypothetical protein